MDKDLFANDGSFMERFKQMQQEKEKAAAAASAGGSSSKAPKPVNPKQPVVAIAANKRPLEVKKAGPVSSGGKLAFSLKKAKVAVAPVFAPDDEDEDASEAAKEEPARKSVQADRPAAAAPIGAVGNYFFFFHFLMLVVMLSFSHCCTFLLGYI